MATRAFLVGINDYSPAGAGGPDLQGCVNDVRDMANTLVILGFSPKTIKLCTDKRATRKNITDGINWLIKGSKKGDSLVFYYSGHGSQIVDVTNDESTDFKDEILCPHDISFTNGVFITDDDLSALLSSLHSGTNLDVIFDCCHSGSGTRETEILQNTTNEIRNRYLKPPVDFTFNIDYDPGLQARNLLRNSTQTREISVSAKLAHTLWTACREGQTCEESEIKGVVRGVFTYHLCRVLRRTNGNISRKRLNSLVSAAVSRAGFTQVPQLEVSNTEMLEKPFRTFVPQKTAEVVEEEMF